MYNPFSLENKTIFVTGASSGIGKAVAVECSKMGANVVITVRNEERLKKTYDLLDKTGDHKMFVADLLNNEEVINLVHVLPQLDGCVNNAGITKIMTVPFIDKQSVEGIFAINTISPILLTRHLIKAKKISNSGSIVFTSSISGVYCSAVASSLYSASKAAINGFVKGAALDLVSKKIRVNSVNPGMIDTGIFSEGVISEEQLIEDAKKYPMKRYGKPEEVAYAVVYLLSDASAWVTGSSLLIDGGYTLL